MNNCLDVEVVQQNEDNSGDDDDNSETVMTEMRFAPDNVHNLDAMFQAMNVCQALHPDPNESFSDGNLFINNYLKTFFLFIKFKTTI